MGAWNTKIDGNDIYLDVKCYLDKKMKQVSNLDLAIAKTMMEFVGISEAYDIQMFIALLEATIEIGKPYKTIIKKAISFIEMEEMKFIIKILFQEKMKQNNG